MNDDINYKRYFIDNKVDADIQNSFIYFKINFRRNIKYYKELLIINFL